MGKLDGKVALITGAAVGLGEGISTAYAKYGAKLVMVDLDPKVEETAARLRKEYGAEIVTVVANVADREQMDAAAKKAPTLSVKSMLLAATPAFAVWLRLKRWTTKPAISTSTSTSKAYGTPVKQ